MNTDTPRTDAAVSAAPEYATPEYVHGDFARELERENARMRGALESAEREFVRLFTVLPIGGVLPSPSVIQHVQWARQSNKY